MEIAEFIIVMLCGLGIGVLSGMFGIGGGGLIVPLLHMAFGMPILGATSTSLLTIAFTGISGSIKHIRQKTADLKFGVILGCAGAIASVGGALVSASIPSYMVVVLTVVVILFSVGMMVRSLVKDKGKKAGLKNKDQEAAYAEESGVEGAETSQENSSEPSAAPKQSAARTILLPLIIGLIAGGIAGIVGVGGGFIIVPFCVAYLGFSMKRAAGTSLISITLIAIPGIITHAILGHIWWLYGIAIIIGTIPGAQVGAWLIARLPERPMRFAFAALLTILGIMMLVQEFLL